MYGKWGFRDAVNTSTNHVSDGYLSLDQGMAMAALGNALGNDVMRTSFATASFKKAIRPVIGVEEFNVSPRGCTITGTPGNDVLTGTSGDDVICGAGWRRRRSTPATGTMSCTATAATTPSAAVPARTPSTATTATTRSPAGTATTSWLPAPEPTT